MLTWAGYDLWVDTPNDGQKRVKLPYIMGDGENAYLQLGQRSKSFGPGDRITFSAQELMEVCWTVYLFADDLSMNVQAYAQQQIVAWQSSAGA